MLHYRSPTKKYHQLSGSVNEELKGSDGSDDSEDSDYMPGDACSSKKDDEAAEILSKYKAFKKKLRKGEMASLDDVVLGSKAAKQVQEDTQSEGYDTPYVDSDADDLFEEIGSDREIRQKKDHYRRFKSSDDVPKFELGMKFCGKKIQRGNH